MPFKGFDDIEEHKQETVDNELLLYRDVEDINVTSTNWHWIVEGKRDDGRHNFNRREELLIWLDMKVQVVSDVSRYLLFPNF